VREVRDVRTTFAGVATLLVSGAAHAQPQGLQPHATVTGSVVTQVEIAEGEGPGTARSYAPALWSSLSGTRVQRGPSLVRMVLPGSSAAVELPVCSGRGLVWVDGKEVSTAAGPVVLPLTPRGQGEAHEVTMGVTVGDYERRIACGSAPRAGAPAMTTMGLAVLDVAGGLGAGGGHAVVFIPTGHDVSKPGAVLVGAHPWNGSIWTYAAYSELLDEAAARDVMLLMPSGLGNSLYTAAAEDEVMAAIDALSARVAVDPRRVSLWGASMGGAGATTIGFHHPDRFASVTSFFGDSKYDLSTYVRAILRDEAGAHLVNAMDVVDNARYVPVWLIHGEQDKVSPIAQSEMLAQALQSRGFTVRFDRAPRAGHEGTLVAQHARQLVDLASSARTPDTAPRVTYRSVRSGETSAYGVRVERASATGDAYVDVERVPDGVRVHRATGIVRMVFARGAFGFPPSESPSITRDAGVTVQVEWDPLPAAVQRPSTQER
jgi:pimeloyl-ACP methyl ester carboxylesterase